MNRIANAIAVQEKNIVARLADGRTTQANLDSLNRTLDMEPLEYCRFQDLKSLAVSDSTITLEEGQLVYGYLGESPNTFNNQPLAVKVILTNMFKELMEKAVR